MLSEVLRLLRISQDWTIKELSEKMKVSSSYISELEKGVKKPSLDILDKYSAAIGIDRSTILYFEEEGGKNDYGYQKLLLHMLEKVSQ
ncbi:MAG: helix-turn-helix domain-containing protein [Defluviitaleaceae bacterium]|nr:helix-turn-helix domain-containing protein [Defluviitaleaceae bacterium]